MESGLRTPDPPGETGGLIVMVRPDPAVAARELAHDLHAALAIGGIATEAALARLDGPNDGLPDLDELTAAMRRAEAVRDATRAAVADRLSANLNTKIAIHPTTLRRCAAELIAAELAVRTAVARTDRRTRRARRTRVGAGTGTAAAGVVVGVALAAPLGPIVAAAGLAAGGLGLARGRRRAPVDHTSLHARVDLARSRWEQVAGVGADPFQVEATIHRYDPQDGVVAALVSESPAVRAADRMALERRVAWVAAWRHEVGDTSPPPDPLVDDLLRRDQTQLWLTSGPTPRREEPGTLVVAAPYAELDEERARQLHRRLLGLPKGRRVIVVLPPDPAVADAPAVGWAAANSPG